MFAIFVTVNIKPGHVEQFTEASLGDARGSVRDEPGCFRFDILKDPENQNRFYLYEVYADEAAFEAHKEAPHFKEWFSTVEDMLAGDLELIKMDTEFPSDEGWEKQKPGLLNW